MNLSERVKELARKVPSDPSDPGLPEGLSDSDIKDFEHRNEIVVPTSLHEWLKFTNGPSIGAGGVRGIRTRYPEYDIEHYYKRHPLWLRRGWIPIAGDGCGNHYVVATRDEDGPGNPVFFIDCHMDKSQPAYVVASDIWHFFKSYLSREVMEIGWPFDPAYVLREDPSLAEYSKVPKPWEL